MDKVVEKKNVKCSMKHRKAKVKIPKYAHGPYFKERVLMKFLSILNLLVLYVRRLKNVFRDNRLVSQMKQTNEKDSGKHEK